MPEEQKKITEENQDSTSKESCLNNEPCLRIQEELLKPAIPHYGTLIGWGIFSVVLGTIGLFMPLALSIGVSLFTGAMLTVVGATGLALFWKLDGWGNRLSSIFFAIISVVTGLLLLFYPVTGAETITLFLASYFIAIGLIKAWMAVTNTDTKGWSLMLFSAIISLLLGACLWWGWPQNSLWILGVFVAIELIFDGWTAILFGFDVRRFMKSKK